MTIISCTISGAPVLAGDVPAVPATSAATKEAMATEPQKLVLAGGCFWGVEAVFQHITGVTNVVSGYAGGTADTAHYEKVSKGMTSHAEAVEITYDPRIIKREELLQVFFTVAHNPTELNYQGPDHGAHYRSAIFYADEADKAVAADYIARLSAAKTFAKPIVTSLEPLTKFYPAETYHQDFAARNPDNPYIMMHDAPKVRALQKLYPALYKKS